MPYITVESGALSDEQKELLIKRFTEAQRIFMAQGIAGVMEFTRNMALKNI